MRPQLTVPLSLPADLHADSQALIVRFAEALAAKMHKMHKAEVKYCYDNGWRDDDWQQKCAADLLDHVAKGDPRDVAIYCAFMWHHGWRTSINTTVHP